MPILAFDWDDHLPYHVKSQKNQYMHFVELHFTQNLCRAKSGLSTWIGLWVSAVILSDLFVGPRFMEGTQ